MRQPGVDLSGVEKRVCNLMVMVVNSHGRGGIEVKNKKI
jgi:hypothetical protein